MMNIPAEDGIQHALYFLDSVSPFTFAAVDRNDETHLTDTTL
jgi:hypothetical protein